MSASGSNSRRAFRAESFYALSTEERDAVLAHSLLSSAGDIASAARDIGVETSVLSSRLGRACDKQC